MISIVWCPHLISSPAPTPIKIICSHNEEWDYLINLINGMDYGWVGTFTIRSASLPCYYYYQLLTIYILHIFMQIYYHTHTSYHPVTPLHHIILSNYPTNKWHGLAQHWAVDSWHDGWWLHVLPPMPIIQITHPIMDFLNNLDTGMQFLHRY